MHKCQITQQFIENLRSSLSVALGQHDPVYPFYCLEDQGLLLESLVWKYLIQKRQTWLIVVKIH